MRLLLLLLLGLVLVGRAADDGDVALAKFPIQVALALARLY